MANETTTVTANDGLPTVVSSKIVQLIRENTFLADLVYKESLVGVPGLTVNVPTWSTTLTATAITTGANEGDAQAAQAVSTGVVALTAASKVVIVEPTDLVVDASTFDLAGMIDMEIARTMAAAVETAITDLFGGFSNSVGTSGVDMTIADLRSATITYRTNAMEFAQGGVIVLHPVQLGDLEAELMSGSGAGLSSVFSRGDIAGLFGTSPGSSVLSNYVGNWLGNIPVFVSTAVGLDGGSANREGAIFKPSVANDINCAIGMVMKWLPTIDVYDGGVLKQATHIHRGKIAFGTAELNDSLGVGIVTDA